MSNMDLKFGSVSSSPAGQQQQNARGIDRDSPAVVRSGAMSGGANPPKNFGQNVSEMTFGDIEVKPEGSPSHESKSSSRGNSLSGTTTPNGGSPYRGSYEQRQHPRNSPGYVKNNNAYYNQRGPKNQQQYVQGNPQMLSPYNIYQAAAAAVAGSPFFYGQQMPQYYAPTGFNGAGPYSPQQQSGSSSPKPPGPSSSQSPVQQHRSTPKPHTTIKLSDPVTHQPIDLKSATNKTPVSSTASLSSTSSASTNSVPSIPKENTPPPPSSTDASTSGASSQRASVNIRDQLKEQIRLKLEAEKKKKEEEDKAEMELKEKERLEREAEQAELERLENERLAKEAAEKAQEEKEWLEKEQKDREEAARIEEEKLKTEKAADVEDTTAGDTEEKVTAALASVNSQLKQAPSLSSSQHAETPVRAHPAKNFADAFRPTVEELQELSYPPNINKPKTAFSTGRYIYDSDFLNQFQSVVLFPPREDWDTIKSTFESRGASGGKGVARTPSKGIGSHGQQAMGSFGSGNSGFRDRSTSGGPGGFHNMGSGHGGKSLSRMNSSTNLVGRDSGNARSGRQSSRRGKGNERSGSNRDHHDDHNSTMTGRNPDIVAAAAAAPLKKAENAWVPRVRSKKEEQPVKEDEAEATEEDAGIKTTSDPAEISETVRMPPDLVQRKVKSFLNKMTLENFDRILQRIMDVAKQSKYEKDGRTLRQIIELTFAKAVDEAHWSSMYAKFCFEMTNRVDPEIEDENVEDRKGGPLFRKYLLSRCQEEFERGWTDKLPTNPDGTAVDPDLMSDEYYQAVVAKRRGLGLIRFIGELYILGLLSDKIINSCIIKLCIPKDPSEEVIESLCKLMTTVGRRLDANPQCKRFVDRYIDRMSEIQQKPGLPSRLRFMLMDVRDLRNNKWRDKNAEKGPKTLQEIHDEAQKKEQESARGDRGRPFMGRSDSKSNSFNIAGDLSKIGRIRSQGTGQPTLGPTSLNRDLSRSNGSHKSPSPGIPLSKEPSSSSLSSRTPSQNQRANIFEHLNDEEDRKLESETQAENDQA